MPLLENHTAVVTGAAMGIGRAIAEGFAREAARVVLLDLDADAAASAARDIRAAGGKADSFRLDVSDRVDCFRLAELIAGQVGQVSVLVNNAGITRRNSITADVDAVHKDWQDVMAVNLDGVYNVTHAFLPALRSSRGRIINLSSVHGFMHARQPASPAYTASKHAVIGLTRALAAQLAADGVRVNAIAPGFVETPLNANTRANNLEAVKLLLDHIPMGRAGYAEEVAGPALFLASDMSSYVTGSVVMVDGGYRTV
jgi:NAD(P)-dependent dehydrogenase (short-subunit alcohol dehydrogenase family)